MFGSIIDFLIFAYLVAALVHLTRRHGLKLSDFADAIVWPGTKLYRFLKRLTWRD